MKKICIGIKNMKMGKIPTSSMVPIKDCIPNCPCAKKCYAMKAYRLYPDVKKGWQRNSWLARHDYLSYYRQHNLYIQKHKPKFFRFFVGGDFISHDHFTVICHLALKNPGTKFLVFTKQYKFIDPKLIPDNLKVILSMWPGVKYPPRRLKYLSRAYVEGCRPDKRMEAAYPCKKKCDECFACWNLIGDVKFKIH